MEHILYLLKLKNKKAFKVGITNSLKTNRVHNLHKIYEFDLKESYLVKSSEKIIKQMERQLLTDYEPYKHEFKEKKDGHSEFLKMECFDCLFNSVKFKTTLPHLNIEIIKGVVIEKPEPKPKVIYKKPESKPVNELFDWDFDFDEYDIFKKLVLENKDKIEFEMEYREMDGITGRIGNLIVRDYDLTKHLYYNRTIKQLIKKGDWFNFVHSAQYLKNDNVGMVGLMGVADSFDKYNLFDVPIIHNKIKDLYDFLIETVPTTVNKEIFAKFYESF